MHPGRGSVLWKSPVSSTFGGMRCVLHKYFKPSFCQQLSPVSLFPWSAFPGHLTSIGVDFIGIVFIVPPTQALRHPCRESHFFEANVVVCCTRQTSFRNEAWHRPWEARHPKVEFAYRRQCHGWIFVGIWCCRGLPLSGR